MRKSRYLIFYNIVFVYIVASFIFWWYLLQKNNTKNFNEFINQEKTLYADNNTNFENFYKTELYKKSHKNYMNDKYLLFAEGFIFISLISLGFWRIRNTFREEISLTRRQNNFLLSITHELKSPLASLKLSMQTLQKRNLNQEKILRLADISIDDVDRLEALVENILLASKIGSPGFKIEKELLNLSVTVTAILNPIKEKYKLFRLFETDIDEDIYITADRLSFSSVIYNLIENAIKYSRRGSRILVKLKGDDTHIYISVADTGIGIPEHEKSKIFERFYRIGSEETRTTKGTGLGLFIVKQVVAFHNGSIEVKNNEPCGSIFKVTLPVTG